MEAIDINLTVRVILYDIEGNNTSRQLLQRTFVAVHARSVIIDLMVSKTSYTSSNMQADKRQSHQIDNKNKDLHTVGRK